MPTYAIYKTDSGNVTRQFEGPEGEQDRQVIEAGESVTEVPRFVDATRERINTATGEIVPKASEEMPYDPPDWVEDVEGGRFGGNPWDAIEALKDALK